MYKKDFKTLYDIIREFKPKEPADNNSIPSASERNKAYLNNFSQSMHAFQIKFICFFTNVINASIISFRKLISTLEKACLRIFVILSRIFSGLNSFLASSFNT